MYRKTTPNLIESDEGYMVEILGRTGVMYIEGQRRLFIDSEILLGPSGMAIYTNSIKAWEPPFSDEEIDGSKKMSIIENIRRAFRFEGFEIHVYP